MGVIKVQVQSFEQRCSSKLFNNAGLELFGLNPRPAGPETLTGHVEMRHLSPWIGRMGLRV